MQSLSEKSFSRCSFRFERKSVPLTLSSFESSVIFAVGVAAMEVNLPLSFGLLVNSEKLTVLNFGRILCQGETREVLAHPDVIKAYLGE